MCIRDSGVGAGFLAASGVMRMFTKDDENAQFYILAFYFIVFAVVIALGIIQIAFVLKYFSFLKGYFGQGAFLAFAGLLLFDWDRRFEFATSLILLAGAAINMIISCKAPPPT
eukprot:TRINITY_DN8840_c0_g1_i5.p2 TRINITY_DN8840_c0_g1~~TRINITY_DN8840_c0_g1_i5.p2  ORF type:complete len:113 (+),score=10.59 TRINITY_DN8840_c0_g1_i5:71-409(+)